MGKIDENSNHVAMGYDADNDLPVALSIDNVTGYVRAVASMGTGSPTAYAPTVDANSKGIAFGTDSSGNERALIVDASGNLRCTE